MTAHDELRAFARALELTCKKNNLKFACLHAEHDLEPAPRWALAPYLFLTQVAAELACGHIVPTAEGVNLFIRVRTPFAASSTLKFVTLRTYSLILVAPRGLKTTRFERDLNPAAAQTDLQQILAQAVETAIQAQTDDQAFIQPEQSAPLPTKNPELLPAQDSPEHWRRLRELCADVVQLRRGDHAAERLRLDRERLGRDHDQAEADLEIKLNPTK